MLVKEFIKFWFVETPLKTLFTKDINFDNVLKDKFLTHLESCSKGDCFEWRSSAQGSLAEIIILDQLSRNIYRDTPKAFASDGMALVLAQESISKGYHKELADDNQRRFLYMPFMHSESNKIQEISIELFASLNQPETLHYAKLHKVIIDRFGRYPHRNKILNRQSTEKEIAFLLEENSSF